MATIIFLIFVGALAFGIVFLARSSAKKRDSVHKDAFKQPFDRLTPASSDRLSRKDEIWEARRKFAESDLSTSQKYVPKSFTPDEPEYDGYSRRDRHHLTAAAKVKHGSRVKPAGEQKPAS